MSYALITVAAVVVALVAFTAPLRAGRWKEVAAGAALLTMGYAWAVLAAAGVRMPNPTDLISWISVGILRLLGAAAGQ